MRRLCCCCTSPPKAPAAEHVSTNAFRLLSLVQSYVTTPQHRTSTKQAVTLTSHQAVSCIARPVRSLQNVAGCPQQPGGNAGDLGIAVAHLRTHIDHLARRVGGGPGECEGAVLAGVAAQGCERQAGDVLLLEQSQHGTAQHRTQGHMTLVRDHCIVPQSSCVCFANANT